MILHIMYDAVITPRTITYFKEALQHCNKFVVILPRKTQSKYVITNDASVVCTNYGSSEFWNAIGNISSYDYIIIHNLVSYSIRFICHINHPRIVWCVWGMDLYNGYLANKGYSLHYDKELVKKFSQNNISVFRKIWNLINKRRFKNEKICALKKIAYISAFDGEIELLKQYYPETKRIKKKDFFYYPVDSLIPKASLHKERLGNDIMIGNSASLTGNHYEVFLQLLGIDLKGRNVVVPLSYGNAGYKEYLIKKGYALFGSSFKPLTEFMPIDKYIDEMQTAKTYIYGNYRQEGVGNILMSLCWGGTVFLHPHNVLLSYYRNLGCVLFSTEELSNKINYELTEEEKQHNKTIILEAFSYERLKEFIVNSFGPSSI